MKPEARSKWLSKAVQQAHPQERFSSAHSSGPETNQRMKDICKETFLWQDGRLSPKSIYEIIAHTKFVKDISEKLGQRMYEAQILGHQWNAIMMLD